ncbi:MAG: YqgE/AlgH family protein [Muribaculaceae bacterium]|nr:YqgE/AlgH family protein [Muribaculaceae bacterium]
MKNTYENKDINADSENIDKRTYINSTQHKVAEELRKGTILVASPFLEDPNFKRTVILILDKDSTGGYIGLILNRPLNINLEDVFNLTGINACLPLQEGGPVDLQRIFWIHTLGQTLKGAIEILPGLYVGGDYEEMIAELMESDENLSSKIKLYLGYSGWSVGQLEKEIELGAWGILPDLLDPQLTLELNGEELWNQLCLKLGPDFRHWRIIPKDPNMN